MGKKFIYLFLVNYLYCDLVKIEKYKIICIKIKLNKIKIGNKSLFGFLAKFYSEKIARNKNSSYLCAIEIDKQYIFNFLYEGNIKNSLK